MARLGGDKLGNKKFESSEKKLKLGFCELSQKPREVLLKI